MCAALLDVEYITQFYCVFIIKYHFAIHLRLNAVKNLSIKQLFNKIKQIVYSNAKITEKPDVSKIAILF